MSAGVSNTDNYDYNMYELHFVLGGRLDRSLLGKIISFRNMLDRNVDAVALHKLILRDLFFCTHSVAISSIKVASMKERLKFLVSRWLDSLIL